MDARYYDPKRRTGEDVEQRALPVLVYTRKYGWIVVEPWRGEVRHELFGYSRPGGVTIYQYMVLATQPLPSPPDSAA